MISHKHKAIFIHIPKCAGTSVEKLLGVGYNENSPDHCSLYGWDSEKQLHLHHATAEQLLDFGLIDKETWNSYFKFTFVRNPWDRAFSDYFWMMHDQRVKDSFDQFLLKKGAFYKCLNDRTTSSYRGDHMMCQLDYITVNGKIAVDYVGNVESFQNDLQHIGETIGLPIDEIPHNRKSNNLKFKHYSQLYTRNTEEIVSKLYQKDIKAFNYHFHHQPASLQEWGFSKLYNNQLLFKVAEKVLTTKKQVNTIVLMKQFLSYTFARIKRLLKLDFYYKRVWFVKKVVDAYKRGNTWIFNTLSLASDDKYVVVHLTDRKKGVRFNQMIAEGLLSHPNIEEVYFSTDYISFGKVKKSKDFNVFEKMKSCDLIFIPNREHFGLPEYLKFIEENEYWGKVVFYDKKDSADIDSEILSKCLLYVKRSFPIGYARLPRRIHPKLLPLDYSFLKEYSELSRLDLDRDIDISCFFHAAEKISDRRTRIAKILLDRSSEFENSTIGNVNIIGSDARRAIYETFENNMLHPYFQKMCRSKVIITAYPADWDGDSRTYEAFASGALVVMDRTYIPSPYPIEDGKHALIYDATSDQSVNRVLDRIKYYLNHDEEREEIAKAGKEFVSKHHSSVARVDLILQHAKKAMSL